MSRRVGFQKAVKAAVVLGALQVASPVLALGLGDMELQSFLNEPLRADVILLDLRGLAADDIRIRLGGVDDFERMGVERNYFLTSIKFEVVVNESAGTGAIRLTTDEAILEPFLDLIIEARWPTGRLLREYTVLVDPPAFRQDVLTVSASEEVRKTEAPSAAANEPVKQDSSSSSGDEVTMRGSNLAPGQMPERAFSAETALRPEAGSRYMVKRDETLWQIAASGRPQNTSVQQAMLDIQRLNPEAFIDGNINRIKAGYIIYLPEPGDITSDDLASALEEVREQNQAFNSRRSAPGVTAAATATLRVSADSDSYSDTDSDRDGTPSRDTIAATTTPVDNDPLGDEGVADDLQSTDDAQDNASARSDDGIASAELAAQLNAMAGRLDTLEQIVALKDQQIATLEQALREARETASAVNAAPAPVVTSAPASSSDTSSTGFPWWPLIGGIAAILAILAFAVLRRRRAGADGGAADSMGRDDEDDVFAGVNLKREALEPEELDKTPSGSADEEADASADTLAGVVDDTDDDAAVIKNAGGDRGYGERKNDDYNDEGSSGDALAEADIYIAYGRYLQAIELLNTAIGAEPENNAYRLKLIELYVDMGEEGEAEQQLKRLRASDDQEAIGRAEALVGGGLGSIDSTPPLQREPADQSVSVDTDEVAQAPQRQQEPLDDAEDDDLLVTVSDEELLEQVDSAAFAQSVDSQEPIEFEGLQIADEAIDDVAAQAGDELDIAADFTDDLDLSEALDDADATVDVDGSGDEELLIAEDADQMATKLDLARAYLDMGDGAGARAILEAVIGGGSGEQQQEARELLTRID